VLVPVTVPTPWSIESDVAPLTLHERVEDSPGEMVEGEAVKKAMTGTWPELTTTVTVAVRPDALAVTVADPAETAVTSPELLTATAAALEENVRPVVMGARVPSL
jgi:hypothetical protein